MKNLVGDGEPGKSQGGEVVSRVDHVYELVRSWVISGAYRPGEQLRVAELAEKAETSASPVREALRRLQSEGFVEFIANKGVRVSKASSKDLKDIYNTRRLLEGQALTMAHPYLDGESLDKGLELVSQMTFAFEAGDIHERDRLHRAVHFSIYEPANSPWLLKLIGIVWDNCGRYLSVSPRLRESPKAFAEEHERMLRVASTDTAENAVAELHRHLTHTESLMMANYEPGQPGAGFLRGPKDHA